MRKLLLGMSYFTWLVCNLAVIYGIGLGAYKLIESTSIGDFILNLALGMIILLLIALLSGLTLGLMAMVFNDEKVSNRVAKWFPFMDIKSE